MVRERLAEPVIHRELGGRQHRARFEPIDPVHAAGHGGRWLQLRRFLRDEQQHADRDCDQQNNPEHDDPQARPLCRAEESRARRSFSGSERKPVLQHCCRHNRPSHAKPSFPANKICTMYNG